VEFNQLIDARRMAILWVFFQGLPNVTDEPAQHGGMQAAVKESTFDRTTPPRLGISRHEVRRL
jgi:hypothetical protein